MEVFCADFFSLCPSNSVAIMIANLQPLFFFNLIFPLFMLSIKFSSSFKKDMKTQTFTFFTMKTETLLVSMSILKSGK